MSNAYAPSQALSSDQHRQMSCLVANGAVQLPRNRDISPDRIIFDMGCHVVERVTVVYVPDHAEWCRAMDVLQQAGLDPRPVNGCGITYREVAA